MKPKIIQDKLPADIIEERSLSVSRERRVRDCAVEAGLKKSHFMPKRVVSPKYSNEAFPILIHQPTGSWFIFGGTTHKVGGAIESGSNESFESWWDPGVDGESEHKDHNTWTVQVSAFKAWLERVKAKVEEPDLWAETLEAKALLPIDIDNEAFSADEKAKLSAALERIEQHFTALLKDSTSDDDFRARVQSEFAELRQLLDSEGHRRWLWMFTGALMSWAVGAALDGASVANLLHFASGQLGTSLGQAVGYVQDVIKTTE